MADISSHDATFYQLKQARITAKKLVQNLLPQFFLRRMKSLIAHQLPKKTDRVVFCPLTDTQKAAYELFLDSDIVDVVRRSSEPCPCNSGKKSGWCCYATLPHSNTKWQVSQKRYWKINANVSTSLWFSPRLQLFRSCLIT